MDIKKLLMSHKEIDDSINLKLEELAQLRAVAERCTVRISNESRPVGTHSDKVGRNAARIADLENKIDAQIDELVELKEKIMYLVAALDDDNERIVTERRYILHESIEQISEKLGYSPRHISRMLTSALVHLEEHYADIMMSA